MVEKQQVKLLEQAKQIIELNQGMIEALATAIEFRNEESGGHVQRISEITRLMLENTSIGKGLAQDEIDDIALASIMHDVGKITIPDSILTKPGRLTPDEYEVMKTHTTKGVVILESIPQLHDSRIFDYACDIALHHHERWDGRGYPEGLEGSSISPWAQVVSLADVYDALTSPRVYKPAHPHEKALSMILNGECGAFQPLLLECLVESSDIIQREMAEDTITRSDQRAAENTMMELSQYEELSAADRTLRVLEQERTLHRFFTELSSDILFEYASAPPVLTLSPSGVQQLGLEATTLDPYHDKRVQELVGLDLLTELSQLLRNTTPESPVVEFHCAILLNGRTVPVHITSRSMWSADEPPQYTGAIGKVELEKEVSQ